MKRLRVTASTEQLNIVQELVHSELESVTVSEKVLTQLDIVVEEIFVNISHYAYGSKEGDAVITCEVEQGEPAKLKICFEDWGKPFNPLEKEDADITLSAEERKVGGLGIYMVKNMMDNVTYKYEKQKNVLTVWKNLS